MSRPDLEQLVFEATAAVCGFPASELRLGTGGSRPLTYWRSVAAYVALEAGSTVRELAVVMQRAESGVHRMRRTITTEIALRENGEPALWVEAERGAALSVSNVRAVLDQFLVERPENLIVVDFTSPRRAHPSRPRRSARGR